jgi:hypothetical protein
MLSCISAYTQVFLHRLPRQLLQSLAVTLDQQCATRKAVLEEGFTLVPPRADINRIRHVLSTPSLKGSQLPSLQPRPASSASLAFDTFSDIPDLIPDLPHVLHSVSIKSSSVSLATSSSESSASDFNSQLLAQKFTLMSSNATATVTLHPGHKVAPVLSNGIVTPGALLDWENACDDFFVAAKEPITDDKKVSKVTGGLQNSRISVYVRNNRARLHALTFPIFMSELRETFLPADWDKDTL